MTTDLIDGIERAMETALKEGDVSHGLARAFRLALKETATYRTHMSSAARWPAGIVDLDASRVQIGGGTHLLPGFLNIDITPPADLLWDVREGIPLRDAGTSFVFTEHFLEHIDYPSSAKHVAAEIYRVLKHGGSAVIGVPDGHSVLKGYINRDHILHEQYRSNWYTKRNCQPHFNSYIDLVNYVFRDQDDDAVYSPHLWAYDYDKLVSLCQEIGFREVGRWVFDPEIANPKREWGSVYILATK
jgi:SAM-dependent methyltransferase